MKKSYSRTFSVLPLALTLCAAPALAAPPAPTALPTGGQVTAGQAAISQSGSAMTINQTSDKAILNWQTFNIGSQAAVRFSQPSASAVALNRVLASEASQIYGNLTANGQVYLVNPAGIVFGPGSRVDVGGLVASTLDITDADFLAGKRTFSRNNATGSITNQGEITAADGGLVALLAPTVVNEGAITARLGNVALAAGDKITLAAGADGLLQLAIDPATLQTLIDNRQLIVADGGQVLMTSKAADALAAGVVANSGTIQARTLQEHEGRILLLADMEHGEVNLSGNLDASAPSLAGERANGGFVETSAAQVKVADTACVTTLATNGNTGLWLIDPDGFTIAASGGDMTGAAVGTALVGGNFSILSTGGSGADGDINVNDTVSWNANKLTLTATNDVNVNAVMTASGTASLDLAPGSTKVNMGLSGTGFYGRVDFPGRSGVGFLTVNGAGYTVINSLGAEGSVTGTDLQGMNGDRAGKYALGANIDASATTGWNAGAGFVPVGLPGGGDNFEGTFDGLGHTVNGLTINRPATDWQGMFMNVTGTIRNVGLVGGSVIGKIGVGGLACSVLGRVSNSYNTGNVSGQIAVGGLVGSSAGIGGLGSISNSYSTGTVTGTDRVGGLVGSVDFASNLSNSYSTGTVSGNDFVGGLVGVLEFEDMLSTISKSYATGTVSGHDYVGGLVGAVLWASSLSDSYSTGTVSGNAFVGGLVGIRNNSGETITNSFWNTQTSGQAASAGGIGLTTAQMQQQAIFAGWDISAIGGGASVWRIYEGQTAPLLRGLLTPLTVTASNASKTYDGLAYSSATVYTTSAAADASKIFGTVASSGLNVGTHAISASGLYSNQQGYDLSYANGTLTVNPASLTVSANNDNKAYDGNGYSGGNGVGYAGFVNGETTAVLGGALAYGGNSQGAINAGGYVITPSGRTAANYTITFVNGILTINPASLIVSANNDNKTYDGNGYSGGNGVGYSGFVNGETAAVLGGTLAYGGASQGATNAGSYAITPLGRTATNYTITFVNGILTITGAAPAPESAPSPASETADASTPNGGVLWRNTQVRETEPAAPPPSAQPASPSVTPTIEVAQLHGLMENRLLSIPPNFIRLQEE